jgi:hypothetical protein
MFAWASFASTTENSLHLCMSEWVTFQFYHCENNLLLFIDILLAAEFIPVLVEFVLRDL